MKILQFCADKLLCVDSKNDLSVFSLETKSLVGAYSPPGVVTTLHSDPTLDYALIGTQNGEIVAYDLDRAALAPFKIPNLWKELNPRSKLVSVVSLQFHPRDIGNLLIGYSEGAVLYSFKQNAAVKSFHYVLPRGAPGGDSDPTSVNSVRTPKLTQAVWHPTGTFILTGHDDSSIVIWDPKDGRIIMARTLQDTNVDKPGVGNTSPGMTPGTFALKEPLFRIAWCANKDPDDTALLIAGGAPTTQPTKGLTLLELGRTPNYATASWQVLSEHFENPKRQRILPTPPNAEVVDFCLIPRTSPHFAGAQDPIAILALLSSGEVITLSFPSGIPITATNQLHPSLCFTTPFVTHAALSPMNREKWLGLTETRSHGPPIMVGGAQAAHPLKRFEHRNIIQTAHADGIIRIWDVGHGDQIENDAMLQADICRAVGRHDHVDAIKISLAGATGELAAGLRTGEVVIFRWARNPAPGVEPPPGPSNSPQKLTDIRERRDPSLIEGLHPLTLYDSQSGPVTALKISDVGFAAAGFEGGNLVVIDLRGPAIIYSAPIHDFTNKANRRGSILKQSGNTSSKADWPTFIEFSVMTLEDEQYSSILLHVGTNLGNIATFKLLPEASGRYGVQFVASTSLEYKILYIHPLNSGSGRPALATQQAVAGLRDGNKVNGVLLAVSQSGAKIFKPPANKGATKSWDDFLCDAACFTRCEEYGYALVGLFGDGFARAYSVPALKEIAATKISHILDVTRLHDSIVTGSGDALGWTGPAEIALVNLWGTDQNLTRSKDTLWNPDLVIPARPTISNFQWVSGTQMVTPSDMDVLIGGPDRPPSKKMIMQARADEQQRLTDQRRAGPGAASSSAGQGEDEGYWAYMQRQLNERTQNLNLMGDSMDKVGENSAAWADDVSKFVQKQKRNMFMGGE